MFQNVYVVSAVRTAIGNFGGSLKGKTSADLATVAVKEAVSRAGISPETVEDVVLGCVGQHGLNEFLARIVGIRAGCGTGSTGQTVNRLCASGLQAIVTAALAIEHGDMKVSAAGGSESMSNYPYLSYETRFGTKMGDAALVDSLRMALIEPFSGTHVAMTAENIAEKYGYSRERLDAYALESQNRALKAVREGIFKEEIVPVEVEEKRRTFVFDTDEHPRETSMEKLETLSPIFKKDGVVTAGNASGINDAAAAVILMHADEAEALGRKPLARLVDYAVAGVDPNYMGLGPVPATRKLLEKTGLDLCDIGLFELNEAFASQALACTEELGIDPAICNVHGSGISLGHPIGATGAIISVKLLHEMRRRNVRYGIATLCIGGGQGLSVLFENVQVN